MLGCIELQFSECIYRGMKSGSNLGPIPARSGAVPSGANLVPEGSENSSDLAIVGRSDVEGLVNVTESIVEMPGVDPGLCPCVKSLVGVRLGLQYFGCEFDCLLALLKT